MERLFLASVVALTFVCVASCRSGTPEAKEVFRSCRAERVVAPGQEIYVRTGEVQDLPWGLPRCIDLAEDGRVVGEFFYGELGQRLPGELAKSLLSIPNGQDSMTARVATTSTGMALSIESGRIIVGDRKFVDARGLELTYRCAESTTVKFGSNCPTACCFDTLSAQ